MTSWVRRIGLCLIVGTLLICSKPAAAQATDQALVEILTRTAAARMRTDGVPGVVIVILRGGEEVATVVLGLADPAGGRAMTEGALFRVESISKPVTAWGAMRLAETGRIDLDAPIAECLARWQLPDRSPPLTARQLLSHTTGITIGDFTARYAPYSPRPSLAEHIAGEFRIVAHEDGFVYSDTGYNLLELVIEDCINEDFASFMAREILRPLGMTDASYAWREGEMPVGHDLRGMPVEPYVYPGRASGGLYATARDISRFAMAGMEGADQGVLSTEGVVSLQRPTVAVGGLFGVAADGYGLGHFTETLSDGRAAVWHGGQGYGWMSHIHLVPETGDGIVILSNSQRSWPLFAAILRAWSGSLGVEPVGMVRVLWAGTAARFAVASALVVTVFAVRMTLSDQSFPNIVRIGAGGIAVALIAWPLWATTQDYLFLFSILPGLWAWLAAASVLAGLSLAAFAAFARSPERRR